MAKSDYASGFRGTSWGAVAVFSALLGCFILWHWYKKLQAMSRLLRVVCAMAIFFSSATVHDQVNVTPSLNSYFRSMTHDYLKWVLTTN